MKPRAAVALVMTIGLAGLGVWGNQGQAQLRANSGVRCPDHGNESKYCETILSTLAGRIELAPGVPCTQCEVKLGSDGYATGSGAKSDADGAFTLKVGPGNYTAIVSAPGLPPVKFALFLPIVRIEDDYTHELNAAVGGTLAPWRPWPTGSISGRLIATSPQTITAAVIHAEGQGVVAKANADGWFALGDVAPGPRRLQVLVPGRQPHAFTVNVPPGGLVADVQIELDRGSARVPDTKPPKGSDTPNQPSVLDQQKTKVAPKTPPVR